MSSAHSGSSTSVPSDPPPGGAPEENTTIPVNWRVLMAVASCVWGVDKGIRRLSELNIILVIGLWRALRVEASSAESNATASRSVAASRTGREMHRRSRLTRLGNYRGAHRTTLHSRRRRTRPEHAGRGTAGIRGDATVECTPVPDSASLDQVCLHVTLAPERDFAYQVHPVAFPTPGFGGFRTTPDSDRYYRLEVSAATGSMGYDVLGYARDQLINDAPDDYERHPELIRINHEHPGSTQIGLTTSETITRGEDFSESTDETR